MKSRTWTVLVSWQTHAGSFEQAYACPGLHTRTPGSGTRPPRSPAPPPVNVLRAQRHAAKGVCEGVQVGARGGQELVPGMGDAHAAQLADVHAALRHGRQGDMHR